MSQGDLYKYLSRGLEKMPWHELSQSDFLDHVVRFQETCSSLSPATENIGGILLDNEALVRNSVKIMEEAVKNPGKQLNKDNHAKSLPYFDFT